MNRDDLAFEQWASNKWYPLEHMRISDATVYTDTRTQAAYCAWMHLATGWRDCEAERLDLSDRLRKLREAYDCIFNLYTEPVLNAGGFYRKGYAEGKELGEKMAAESSYEFDQWFKNEAKPTGNFAKSELWEVWKAARRQKTEGVGNT